MTQKTSQDFTKNTVVFIHGNSTSSKIFEKVVKNRSLGINYLCIELPGHGAHQSNNFTQQDYSIKNYRKYILRELKQIKGNILLVGNSLGGHLAIEVAKDLDNLKGLVVFGTPPVKHPINFEEAFTTTVDLSGFLQEQPEKNSLLQSFEKVVYNKENVSFLFSEFKRAHPLVRIATLNDLMESNFLNEFGIFTELQIPKYIIIGKSDPTVNHNYLEQVKANSKGNFEFIYFENCGHYASLEQPDEFVKTIEKIAVKVF